MRHVGDEPTFGVERFRSELPDFGVEHRSGGIAWDSNGSRRPGPPSAQTLIRLQSELVAWRRDNPQYATNMIRWPYVNSNGTEGAVIFRPNAELGPRAVAAAPNDAIEARPPRNGFERFLAGLSSGQRAAPSAPSPGVGVRTRPFNTRRGPTIGQPQVAMLNAQATRDHPLHPTLTHYLERLSAKLGVRVEVYSGGQDVAGTPGASRVGTPRHDSVDFNGDGRGDGGLAADVRIYDARTGAQLAGDDLAPVIDWWQTHGAGGGIIGGVGFGMANGAPNGGLHLDLHANWFPVWDYGGGYTPAVAAVIRRNLGPQYA